MYHNVLKKKGKTDVSCAGTKFKRIIKLSKVCNGVQIKEHSLVTTTYVLKFHEIGWFN